MAEVENASSSKWFALVGAATILVVQIAIGLGAYWLLPNWTERGQFGDTFGVANALFSGLALAGIIYAILLQRKDLALQRIELSLTRAELRRSASAQERSEEALAAQAAAAKQSAQLSAVNYLLEHYDAVLAADREIALPRDDPRLAQRAMLEQRRAQLMMVLDDQFRTVVGDKTTGFDSHE